ncbi:MAG: Type 1 glutamine amidotransferase-like domain-containing protein [Candidatus Peribacteria bacterium]|nr:Type 1 glutamine amidotransferase-like domain-containing protein [Candidatus Peribacteria bacterium]
MDALKLNKETREEELEKIFKTDIIYVGGGNTLMMMNKRRKYGIDKLLKQAAEQGIVLS